MKNRGFSLVEVIVGLFLIGILATVMLPLLGFSFINVTRIKERDEMSYICEMVVEKIKAGQPSMVSLISSLEDEVELYYEDEDFDTSKYECKIIKIFSSKNFLEFVVYVNYKDKENSNYVEYKASIPK